MATTKQWISRGLLSLSVLIALVGLAMYAINPFGVRSYDPRQRIFGFGIYRVPAGSMLPTLKTGTFIFTSAGYYRNHEPVRGDIVVFLPPHHPDQIWVKRVIGLPGDHIVYEGNEVSINGKPVSYERIGVYEGRGRDAHMTGAIELRENLPGYPHAILETEGSQFADQGEGDWLVPPGQYFMMGDNRDRSDDSRFWGTVPREALHGKVISRFEGFVGLETPPIQR
jgi:signal peptidase I